MRAMPELLIRIKKKTDGSAALTCVRADGTTTWQRQEGQLGRFFPLHDMTHLAVESVLGFDRAFFGLLAGGWDISDFGKAGKKIDVASEAALAELIVGFFDLERASGVRPSADELNERIVAYFADHGVDAPAIRLAQSDVDRIRIARAELFARWNALPAGEAMVLPFDRSPARSM